MGSDSRNVYDLAKASLTNPVAVCDALGLSTGAKRNRDGYLVHCPAGHGSGGTPSCSVITGGDGTIQVRCFACELSGSVVDLVAAVHSVHPASEECRTVLGEMLHGGAVYHASPKKNITPPIPQRTYMTTAAEYWEQFGRVDECETSLNYLAARGLSAMVAADRDLLRRYNLTQTPKWAYVRDDKLDRAVSWAESGHLLVARAYDCTGEARGLRGWRIFDTNTPKRVPACGYRGDGLVLANERAALLLRRTIGPTKIIITEGESDWLSASTRWPELAVFGVYSGSWSESIAAAIPAGSKLVIMTDRDEAGDNYARKIVETIKEKCSYKRA